MRYYQPTNQVHYSVEGRHIAVARPSYNFESAKQIAIANLRQWYADRQHSLDEEFQSALRELEALTPEDVSRDEDDDDFLSLLQDLGE